MSDHCVSIEYRNEFHFRRSVDTSGTATANRPGTPEMATVIMDVGWAFGRQPAMTHARSGRVCRDVFAKWAAMGNEQWAINSHVHSWSRCVIFRQVGGIGQ